MRITGIGGTGIVTVAQILATAAVLDGRSGAGAGPDRAGPEGRRGGVRPAVTPARSSSASKLGRSRCDLYLGCDVLVATDRPTSRRPTRPDDRGGVHHGGADRADGRRHLGRLPFAGRGAVGGGRRPAAPGYLNAGDRGLGLGRRPVRQHGAGRRGVPERRASRLGRLDRAGDQAERGRGRGERTGVPAGAAGGG